MTQNLKILIWILLQSWQLIAHQFIKKLFTWWNTCQRICFCGWHKWRWLNDRSIYCSSNILGEFWILFKEFERKELMKSNFKYMYEKLKIRFEVLKHFLTNLSMCISYNKHYVSFGVKYCFFKLLLSYEKLWEDIHWSHFNEILVYDPPTTTPKIVYFIKLWHDLDLSMGMLSAYNPDTIPQRQNNYTLFPVYIIPLRIRARCWHVELHLSTLLRRFIVTWPKKFQSAPSLGNSYNGNVWYSASVERNGFLSLIVCTLRVKIMWYKRKLKPLLM